MDVSAIRVDGVVSPVDILELEEAVRRGHLPASTELCHPPWTDGFYRPLTEVWQLKEALDAPAARLSAQLQSPGWPWLTLFISLSMVLSAAHQQEGWSDLGSLSYSAAVLEGRWWTVWSGHWLHWERAPLLHVFGNLTFILYCGMRVEQAWGWSGLARILAGAIAGGAVVVMMFSPVPVIGSSMIAYGVMGAQIAIGIKMGEAIPQRSAHRYGIGTLFAMVLLFSFNKAIIFGLTGAIGFGAGVSHLGHFGGLLGGVFAVFVGRPAVLRPRVLGSTAAMGDLLSALWILSAPAALAMGLALC